MPKENGGKAAAVNHALKEVAAKYLWVFDDDDVACADTLERHVSFLESRPELGFSFGGAYSCSSGPRGWLCVERVNPVRPFPEEEALMELLMDCYTAGPSVVVRMEVMDKVGPHRAELVRSGDLEIAIRWLLEAPAAPLPDERPTYYRRYHDGLRGPAGRRFAYSDNDNSARQFEKQILGEWLPRLELRHLLPRSSWRAGANDEILARGRVRRLALALRKGLWDLALADARELASMQGFRLTPADLRYLWRTFATRPAMQELRQQRSDVELFQLLRNRALRAITVELVRSCVYRAARSWADGEHREAVADAAHALRLFRGSVVAMAADRVLGARSSMVSVDRTGTDG